MLIAGLAGAFSILATWVVFSLAFIGIGLAIQRRLGESDSDDVITAFWWGFSASILLLQFWHLALPVSWHAFLTVLALGALGCWRNRRSLVEAWDRTMGRKGGLLVAVLVLCALWVANGATAGGDDWDYGVYHLPAIKWASTYPVVPGLGNLHGRLAFNSSVPGRGSENGALCYRGHPLMRPIVRGRNDLARHKKRIHTPTRQTYKPPRRRA